MTVIILLLHFPASYQEKNSIKMILHSFKSKAGWEPLFHV